MTLSDAELRVLKDQATRIRIIIIEMLVTAKSGHSAGALGLADVFTLLYSKVLKHNPQKPDWADRDYLLLSNGHTCPVLYAVLADHGYYSHLELKTLRTIGSKLQGHPHRESLPGIEITAGPLGLGLSQAVGLALSLNLQQRSNRVICVTSDGEHQEGQTWEAYMTGAKYNLKNLTVIVDRNNIQIGGKTDTVMPLEPLTAKIASFGWRVLNCNGHDYYELYEALIKPQVQPTAIIAHTTPGKGVDFMENDYTWHGKAPTSEQAQLALAQLKRSLATL